jgi:predicted ATPase/class 3 adenylate cyclase
VSGLPIGTVTFMFSDIEGSTRMLRDLGGDAYGALQDEQAALIREELARRGGVEVRTEGDSFFAVFRSAVDAFTAAVTIQRSLSERATRVGEGIRLRIGLHTGEGKTGGDDYLGLDVNKAARVAASANGGQIVLSSTTAVLVADQLPVGVELRSLGPHDLKDFETPEPLHDVMIDGLDATFPPLRAVDSRRTLLPTPRTSFVGRDGDIEQIAQRTSSSRLVTLTGPGGTGKTRLAIAAASAIQHRFADGVAFVDLSAAMEREPMVGEIAKVLGVREMPGVDRIDAIARHIDGRRLLLVLDNMEQLAEHATVLSSLLDAAPSLSILVTSRVRLHLSGETEIRVPPLSMPVHDAWDDVASARSDSIRLFLERALDVRPGFRLDRTNGRTVVEIVSRLDALPLAIELAAARLRTLDLTTLAQRLEHRLPLLTGGPRDAPERHRTLEACIRWSEESLDPAARKLFARLAVFAGGWSLDAAEAVCGVDLDVLGELEVLADASLVRRAEHGDEGLRFSMLETIREYATERLAALDPQERHETESRHTEYFAALGERAERHLTGEDQIRWLDHLGREHDNIRAVLERERVAGERDGVRRALDAAASIWRFWQQRGHVAEGRSRLERLLELPAAATRDATRARALGAAGSLAYWLADYETMERHYVEAVEIARELGDRRLISHALFNLSFVSFSSGDLEASLRQLNECLEIAEEDDLVLRARASNTIGYGRMAVGDPGGALEPIERAIELHRAAGERLALSESLTAAAIVNRALGRRGEALRRLEEATTLIGPTTEALFVVPIVYHHAILAADAGHARRGAILVGAAERVVDDYEVHFPEWALGFFGDPARRTREMLGDAAYEDAWSVGHEMTLEEAIAFVAPSAGAPD